MLDFVLDEKRVQQLLAVMRSMDALIEEAKYERMALVLRRGYPSDVTDEEWSFALPYLLLCREASDHREHDVREVFNAVRYVAKTGYP
jgi:hypothetical protein